MAHKNICWTTITNAPGTDGDFIIGPAVDALHVTLGAADDDLSFSARIFEAGVGSEVRTGCTYTNSTTTLTRGTLESSTSGSALNFTSAAQVQVVGATAVSAASVELPLVVGPDADTSLVAGRAYVVDAASLTATRTYTLPATAKAGERVQIMLSSGSASYEVVLTAATGDTLNGVAGGAEWSRLFITGEVVTLRCVADSLAWVVEHDGRIPCYGSVYLNLASGAWSAFTGTFPDYSTASVNNPHGIVDVAIDRILARRTSTYSVATFGKYNGSTSGNFMIMFGGNPVPFKHYSGWDNDTNGIGYTSVIKANAGSAFQTWFQTSHNSLAMTLSFVVSEVL